MTFYLLMTIRPLLVLKKHLLSLSVMYSFILIALSLFKVSALTQELPSNGDKVIHIIAYCLFTLLWFFTFNSKLNLRKIKSIALAASLSIGLGILIEILQSVLTQTRQGEFKDVIANVIGTIVAVILVMSMKKRGVKKY